jgi:hypothetical protein
LLISAKVKNLDAGASFFSAYLAFSNERRAVAFEKYLKSFSGRAFAKKRL